MVTFGEKKFHRVLFSLQSFFFQNFATNTAKVRDGHFWMILNKFHVFLIFNGLNEKSFGDNLYVNNLLNTLKPFISLVFKIISNCA